MSICQVEREATNPTATVIAKVAEAIGVEPGGLLMSREEPPY